MNQRGNRAVRIDRKICRLMLIEFEQVGVVAFERHALFGEREHGFAGVRVGLPVIESHRHQTTLTCRQNINSACTSMPASRNRAAPPSPGRSMTKQRRHHLRAGGLQQLRRRSRRATGGDEIVDQQYALALPDRILVHFHFVDAVFERVGDANRFVRQLAALADRNESCLEADAPRLHPE